MAEADRATCPRCDAPISAADPTGLCPRCLSSDTRGDKTEVPPRHPPSHGGASRKLMLASAVAAVGAILFGGFWSGTRRGQQGADAEAHFNLSEDPSMPEPRETQRGADAEAHYNLGVALKEQGKVDEAMAEFRVAIRLKPDYAEAHYNLGKALREQGKPAEAVAELRKARDLVQPGSELARRIESALAESDH